MTGKEIAGGLSVAIGVGSITLYVWQILRHGIKPHIFTWIIWATLALIIFAAMYTAKAGPGCWAMGAAPIGCLLIIGLGFFYGEKKITRSDWLVFIASLSAIPAWIVTKNPLSAIIIATAIDIFSFYPTFRKSWLKPQEESTFVFALFALQMSLSLAAIEDYNLTTVLDMAAVLVLNVSLVFMLLYRRKVFA